MRGSPDAARAAHGAVEAALRLLGAAGVEVQQPQVAGDDARAARHAAGAGEEEGAVVAGLGAGVVAGFQVVGAEAHGGAGLGHGVASVEGELEGGLVVGAGAGRVVQGLEEGADLLEGEGLFGEVAAFAGGLGGGAGVGEREVEVAELEAGVGDGEVHGDDLARAARAAGQGEGDLRVALGLGEPAERAQGPRAHAEGAADHGGIEGAARREGVVEHGQARARDAGAGGDEVERDRRAQDDVAAATGGAELEDGLQVLPLGDELVARGGARRGEIGERAGGHLQVEVRVAPGRAGGLDALIEEAGGVRADALADGEARGSALVRGAEGLDQALLQEHGEHAAGGLGKGELDDALGCGEGETAAEDGALRERLALQRVELAEAPRDGVGQALRVRREARTQGARVPGEARGAQLDGEGDAAHAPDHVGDGEGLGAGGLEAFPEGADALDEEGDGRALVRRGRAGEGAGEGEGEGASSTSSSPSR